MRLIVIFESILHLQAALPSDTKAHQRLLTKGRAQCRKEFFALNPSHCTLFLSHKDCLDHKPRSDDEWESPARIEAIFEALEDPDYAKWFNAKSVRCATRSFLVCLLFYVSIFSHSFIYKPLCL